MKAAGYVRVSTDEQARDGYGLAAQEQAIRAYCQAQSWELVDLYADAGRSGGSLRGRDGLARLLDDARSGAFERVVFLRLDRLGRNLRDLLAISDTLEKAAVGIVSIHEAIDTGTATGRMMRSILGALAEWERDTIRGRIIEGIEAKARNGELVGPLPLGYRSNSDGAVVLDEELAPLVREAFARYATGRHSLRDMAAWAADVGLRSTNGNPLDRLSVRKLLTNVAYTGQVAYRRRRGGGFVVKGKHPPIVDAALFAEVQKQLAGRRYAGVSVRPFGKEPYPLSGGVAICAACQSDMLGLKAGKAQHRYYRCSTAHRRRGACAQRMTRADVLEEQVRCYVAGMRLPREYVGAVVEELRRRDEAAQVADLDHRQVEREIERWRRLFVMGEIDEARYRRETAPLRRRLARLTRPPVLDVERAVELLRDIGSLWSTSSRGTQRAFVREVFDRVVVEGDQLAAIAPKPLYAPLFVLDRRERFAGEGGVIWLPGQDSNLQPSG